MLASRCVAALDTAVKKKPDDGDGNSEIEDLPPAMKLKVLSILGKEIAVHYESNRPPHASNAFLFRKISACLALFRVQLWLMFVP